MASFSARSARIVPLVALAVAFVGGFAFTTVHASYAHKFMAGCSSTPGQLRDYADLYTVGGVVVDALFLMSVAVLAWLNTRPWAGRTLLRSISCVGLVAGLGLYQLVIDVFLVRFGVYWCF